MAAVSTSGLREYADHRATFSGAKRASYVVNHPPTQSSPNQCARKKSRTWFVRKGGLVPQAIHHHHHHTNTVPYLVLMFIVQQHSNSSQYFLHVDTPQSSVQKIWTINSTNKWKKKIKHGSLNPSQNLSVTKWAIICPSFNLYIDQKNVDPNDIKHCSLRWLVPFKNLLTKKEVPTTTMRLIWSLITGADRSGAWGRCMTSISTWTLVFAEKIRNTYRTVKLSFTRHLRNFDT